MAGKAKHQKHQTSPQQHPQHNPHPQHKHRHQQQPHHNQDPTGDYVRRWVPELARLEAPHLLAPWRAPAAALEAAGVALGETYPLPIAPVGGGGGGADGGGGSDALRALRAAGVRARREARRQNLAEWSDARGYDLVVAPKVRFVCSWAWVV